ncbi:SDR family NAD(P)-dependent oxidoreductase [Embleya scabrispora]|uniref:SDR family NAD(P)-dependent oxidoreductase n=1 Tax=Embleya scabrispora TaxID=159449 RepID=UPI00037D8088|nr:SDR family oxidoreductase [Embleya scabrispora]MYS86382.1 SDR family NAD(P)-dependent oxidoreductase [Streptomyces sp. SID5474]
MTALAGANVVITGSGAGIGAALARRFAADGARVVVNDLDADACRAVAADIDGIALPGDAAGEEGVAALITGARKALGGEIDIYCANAGIGEGMGLDASEQSWDRSWDVNVMAHVRAARLLTPAWLARGRGHLVTTVSAAGLLTMLDASAYSVTKHAAYAFAEWMAITYGAKGITVQAVCPLGVRTALLGATGEAAALLLNDGAVDPAEVAEVVAEAITNNAPFLVLPHPEVARMYAGRAADPDRWLAGMRKLQARLEFAKDGRGQEG